MKEAEFHIIKALFIDTFGLPRNFDFAKYMRRALSYHVTDLLDVKEYTWFFLIILVGLNYIRLRMTEVIYGGDASNSIVLSWIIGEL